MHGNPVNFTDPLGLWTSLHKNPPATAWVLETGKVAARVAGTKVGGAAISGAIDAGLSYRQCQDLRQAALAGLMGAGIDLATAPLIGKLMGALPAGAMLGMFSRPADDLPVRWGPATGSGPLGERVAATFRGGSYTEMVTSETTTLYRVYGGTSGQLGSYWTRTAPSGPMQSHLDSALLTEWGGTASHVVRIQVPGGTTIFDGFAAPQTGTVKPFEHLIGGGSQVYIPKVDPSWIVK